MAPAFVYGAFIFTYATKVVEARATLLIESVIGPSGHFTTRFRDTVGTGSADKQVHFLVPQQQGSCGSLITLGSITRYRAHVWRSGIFFFHDRMWGPMAALTAGRIQPALTLTGGVDRLSARAGFAGARRR